MARNVCLHCGEIGHGPFTTCNVCGYRPDSSFELWFAEVASSRGFTDEELNNLSEKYRQAFQAGEPRVINIDDSLVKSLTDIYENRAFLDFRDTLTLKRKAKDTLLRKQMNFHFTGPDGDTSFVVERKKDMHKKLFDEIRKVYGQDVFHISYYDQGQEKSKPVPKELWYLARDRNSLIDRLHTAPDEILRSLYDNALGATERCMSAKGIL